MFGWVPPLTYISPFEDPIGNLSQFILPAISISVFTMAIVMRMVRATMLEVLGQDYVRTARAKGVDRRTVITKHALRNALIPVVTIVGFEIGVLIGGAAIVEIIFGLPGVGYTLLQAIFGRDYPVIQAMTLMIAFTFIFANLLVDILYGVLDPRIVAGMSPRRRAPSLRSRPRAPATRRPPGRRCRGGAWPRSASGATRSGMVGAAIIVFNVLVALFGPYVWTVDPNELVVASLRRPRAGRIRWARTRSGATRWRGSSTGRRSRSMSASISVSIAFVGGVIFGMLAGYYKGIRRHPADAASSTSCSRCPGSCSRS